MFCESCVDGHDLGSGDRCNACGRTGSFIGRDIVVDNDFMNPSCGEQLRETRERDELE